MDIMKKYGLFWNNSMGKIHENFKEHFNQTVMNDGIFY
jgi:hypothetical protein